MARETINGLSMPVPGTGEPGDFQGELRRLATDILNPIEPQVRRAQTLVPFGDSITEQGGELPAIDRYGLGRVNPDTRSFAAWPWANMLLKQAFTVLENLGVGGQTTSQILARIDDVLDLNPGWVVLTAGTNNMGVVGGLAQAKADILAMLDSFDAAGIRVVLTTIPPRTTAAYTGTSRTDTILLNEWIRQLARTRPGLLVADYFGALAAHNGLFLDTVFGYNPTTDGTHLSATGGYACGKALADVLSPFVSQFAPYSEISPGSNLLTSAFARPGTASVSSGTPTLAPAGWTFSGTASAGAVWSCPNRADGGIWKRVVVPTGSTMTLTGTTNATVDGTRLAVGDTVNGILEFEVSAMEAGLPADRQGICLGIRAWNGSAYTDTRYAFNYFRGPTDSRAGALRVPDFVVPSGTVLLSLYLELRGGMTFDFDKPGIYNRDTYPV